MRHLHRPRPPRLAVFAVFFHLAEDHLAAGGLQHAGHGLSLIHIYNASPELGRIRRDQERQQRLIEESLRAAFRKLSSDGATQEELITIRGDRFVIPVRAELKRRVSGVVHGASSSGQTVYRCV